MANDAARAERRLHFLADAGALFAADLDADDLHVVATPAARRSTTRIP